MRKRFEEPEEQVPTNLLPDCPVIKWKETLHLEGIKQFDGSVTVLHDMDPIWPANKANEHAELWVVGENQEPRILGRLNIGTSRVKITNPPQRGQEVSLFISGLFAQDQRNVLARSNVIEHSWQ